VTSDQEAPEGFVRLLVPLERDPGPEGPQFEWLWAEPLGNQRYRIESSPFFAYGLSYDDVVRAGEPEGAAGENPRLEDVERKGGHRTLRIALDPSVDLDSPEIHDILEALLEMGCTYEGLPPKLASIDVPPELDMERVVERLHAPFRDGLLLFEWADPRPS
jgi:hypothetical protein